MIEKASYEEQVHKIQEGRVRAWGSTALPHHRRLTTHGVPVAVFVTPEPTAHPLGSETHQSASFRQRVGRSTQLIMAG